MPVVPITDPNLVAWWKLDEGVGDIVVDWSGHGNHGRFSDDVQWVEGIDGGALEFPRGIVEMMDYEGVLGTQDRTVTAWIKTTAYGDMVSWGTTSFNGGKWIFNVNHNANNGTFEALRTECAGSRIVGSTVLTDGQWHHVATVLEGNGSPTINNIRLYVDGRRETISDSVVVDLNTASEGRKVWLGEGHHDRPFPGLLDDVRIYNRALTLEELKLTMRGDLRLAWDPSPANGSTPNVKDAAALSFSAGENAAQHDVYFGTDRNAVGNAEASDTTGVYRARQAATSYSPPEGVEWGGGPYYWRIDEYNTDATISTGRLWTFTVADFILVDDFEDYNDYPPDEIFSAWTDGWGVATNGALIAHDAAPFAETAIVHGGSQSMAYRYDNNLKYSEAGMTLSYPRDWTEQGVGVLSLWFQGDPANAAEPMYVALTGSSGATAVVYQDDPGASQVSTWTRWTIELTKFSDQGVDLRNIDKISVGFGTRGSALPGGSGVVYFDDIGLYRPSP